MRLLECINWRFVAVFLLAQSGAIAADMLIPMASADKFRSTTLGIAIELPAPWKKTFSIFCLGDGNYSTRDELLRAKFPVAGFINDECGARVTMSVRRRFEGNIDAVIAERDRSRGYGVTRRVIAGYESEFTAASGETGRRVVRRSLARDCPDQGLVCDDTEFRYVLLAGPRLLELECACETERFADIESEVDALVAGLRVFAPSEVDTNSQRTYIGDGFQFDVPAEWEEQLSFDDALNVQVWSLRQAIFDRPYKPNGESRASSAFILTAPSQSHNDSEFLTIDQAVSQMIELHKSVNGARARVSSYRNRASQPCRQVDIRSPVGGRLATVQRSFLLATADGRIQSLSCRFRAAEAAELSPALELLRYSFMATD